MTTEQTYRDSNNIYDYIWNKWNDHQGVSQARWQDYYNNIGFYDGHQWQSWDAKLAAYTRSPVEDDATQRVYLVSNLIRPLADTRMSMILSEHPILEVVSNDKSADAINRADRDTKILKALWLDLNMYAVLTKIVSWMVKCNHCFVRPFWNPDYGPEIKNPKYNPLMSEMAQMEGAEYGEQEYYNLGRIDIDIFSPFEVIFDPNQPTWDRVRRYGWVLIKTVKTIDDLDRQFPEAKVMDLKLQGMAAPHTVAEQLLQLEDYSTYEARKKDKQFQTGKSRNVEVFEYYEAPTRKFRNGRHVITCGSREEGKVLYDSQDSDEVIDNIPIIMFTDQPGTSTLWGKSLISGSRQKQKQYNVIISKVVEITRFPTLTGLPMGVDVSSLEGRSMWVFNYDEDGAQPIQTAPPGVPESWILMLNKIEQDLEHYWGAHEITARAQPPSKGTSGRALFLLKQSDVSRLNRTMMMFGESLSDVGEILLELAKENYTEKRTMNYVGDGGKLRTLTFMGSEDISDKLKVSVEMTSEYKRNKQAYQQFFVQTLGVITALPNIAQILNDPVVFRKLVAYFDEGFANTLITHNQDMAVQEEENKELMSGGSPQVQPWHKHPIHVRVMMDMLNSKEFRTLSQEEQLRIVKQHLAPHLHYIQQGMKMQMMAQQGIAPPNQPGGMPFQQPGETETPLGLIDKTVESAVQPQPGNYGGEIA